jgi:hypothetical protein
VVDGVIGERGHPKAKVRRHVPLPRSGREAVGLAYFCYFAAFGLLTFFFSWTAAWRRLLVQALPHRFVDMTTLTAGWECTRRGVDVLGHHPCVAGVAYFNYPRLWLRLAFLGLGRESTMVIAVAAGLVAAGMVIFVVAKEITARQGAVLAGVALSPAVMLGFERGNIDLLVFSLVALATAGIGPQPRAKGLAAGAALLLASFLKLFPIFAVGTLFRWQSRWRLVMGAGIVTAFGVYALLTRGDIRLIDATTPRNTVDSYGAAVGPAIARRALGFDGQMTFFIATATVIAAIAISLVIASSFRHHGGPLEKRDVMKLDLFWAGAAVFVGTFLLGHNYDYRLVFLTLTVPQLVHWASAVRPEVPFARAILAVMIVYVWLKEFVAVVEILDWVLFVGLLSALLITAVRKEPSSSDTQARPRSSTPDVSSRAELRRLGRRLAYRAR